MIRGFNDRRIERFFEPVGASLLWDLEPGDASTNGIGQRCLLTGIG